MSECNSDAMDKVRKQGLKTREQNEEKKTGGIPPEAEKKGKIVRATRDKNTARGRTKNRVIELPRRRLENPEE